MFFDSWKKVVAKEVKDQVWESLFVAVTWCIWNKRNRITFNKEEYKQKKSGAISVML